MLTLKFYYLIDLHYSQTKLTDDAPDEEFYYLIDLHYSQTRTPQVTRTISFTTL